MRITEINIDKSPNEGLDNINMLRLNKTVVIAGKNGAGKSRLLSKIKSTLSQKPTHKQIDEAEKQKLSNEQNIAIFEQRLVGLNKAIANGNSNKNTTEQIKQYTENIENTKKGLETIEKKLNWDKINTSEISTNYACIDFVPKDLNLKDCNSFNKQQMDSNAKQLDNIGINNTPQSTLSKIQFIQNQWFNATHQNSTLSDESKKEILESYNTLCEYIKIFLNTDLDRNQDGDATLFGFRLGEAKLSNGQKVLLQLCIAIYSQKNKLEDLIIFLDEPENHLHPEALIEIVDKLSSVVTNGQLWIATHSINLLAHVDPSDIWYIENGLVNYSGNLPEKVLNGLLGNDDEISKLTNFLSLPAQMASSKFSFECLLPPLTVETGSDDPQTKQIIDAINIVLEKKDKIKILDFGSGKGRLLSTISDFNNSNNIPIIDWLDYYAYDLPSDDETICKQIISEVYKEDNNRYFNNEQQFLQSISLNSFDMIVMCNVFHEINPSNWLTLFDKNSLILSSLKEDDGILLVVEDQLIAVGEKAYQNGFLVFDKIQFKKLFKIENDYKHIDARGDGRLKAHFIPSKDLLNIDATSRIDAIENLNHISKNMVTELRNAEPSYKNGKLHGFWVQQIANSQLVLSELTN